MDADKHGSESGLIFQDETRRIIGCAMNVLNALGHGFPEKLYENALVVEMNSKSIPFAQQPRFEVSYLQTRVGEFIPDLVVFDKVIVDLKTIDRITDRERGQMINYLKVTKLRVGLLLNMMRPKLEWDRIVL